MKKSKNSQKAGKNSKISNISIRGNKNRVDLGEREPEDKMVTEKKLVFWTAIFALLTTMLPFLTQITEMIFKKESKNVPNLSQNSGENSVINAVNIDGNKNKVTVEIKNTGGDVKKIIADKEKIIELYEYKIDQLGVDGTQKDQLIDELRETVRYYVERVKLNDEGTDEAKEILLRLSQGDFSSELVDLNDSLIKKREKKRVDEDRVTAQLYRGQGTILFLTDKESALDAYSRSVELDPSNSDGWTFKGHAESNFEDKIFEALISFDEALKISRCEHSGTDGANCIKQRKVEAESLGNIASIQMKNSSTYGEAYKNFSSALSIFDGIKDVEGISVTNSNLGVLFISEKDYDQAEIALNKALTLDRLLGRTNGIAVNLLNLASVYSARAEKCRAGLSGVCDLNSLIERGKSYANEAVCNYQSANNKLGIAKAMVNLGTLHAIDKLFLDAEERFNIALNIYEYLGINDAPPEIHRNIIGLDMDKANNGLLQKFAKKPINLKKFFASIERNFLVQK